MIKPLIQFFSTILILLGSSAYSSGEDVMFRNANMCLRYFSYFEKSNNIPDNLLESISIVETKRWHPGSGSFIPWPWAVNSQGKAYYFNSKAEAIATVKKMQLAGQKSIDVGCMQINLMYHPTAFKNLEEAFEPRSNIAYAANFLKNNFKKHNNWKQAVASYHSENHQFGHPYAYKVISHWHKGGRDKNQIGNNQFAKNQVQSRYNRFSEINQRRRKSELLVKIGSPTNIAKDDTNKLVSSLNAGKNIKNMNFIE